MLGKEGKINASGYSDKRISVRPLWNSGERTGLGVGKPSSSPNTY